MEKLGYVEGKDFIIEWRFADLKHERLLGLALELVELNVDVIVAATGRAVKEAQHATRDIPIVMAVNDDPVRMGLVTSLARPGGNTTGLSAANNETLPKQLELLNFVVPNLSRIGYLVNPISADPENPYLSNIPLSLDAAAQALKLTIQRAVVLDPSDLERAFVAMENGHVQAAVIAGGPLLNPLQRRVAELALAYKLRSIAQRREYAEVGLLMSYGER
jgi:putative tryptophan/tyrosine transport system substrate-binding protein